MQLKISKPFWQAISLGVLAGIRSTSAPAITSHILSRGYSEPLERSPLRFMQNKKVAIALKVFCVGEIVGDKLPSAPNRTSSFGLIGRCLSGALAGAGIYKANNCNAFIGAALGSSVAFASTFGSFFLRKGIVKETALADPIIGAVEDVLVAGAGNALVKNA